MNNKSSEVLDYMATDRIDKLELKVDRIVDIFQELMTSQELIQQELKMMNKTLSTVNDLNIKVIHLAADFSNKVAEQEFRLTLGLDSVFEKYRDIMKMFSRRDNFLFTISAGVILMAAKSLWELIVKGS